MNARVAQVRFYVDADIRGLGIILGGLRNDVTYPGDRGAIIHKRERPPCPVTSQDVLDLDWIPIVAAKEWLIITRDSRIAENPLEIAAVRENNAKMVALNQVDAQTKWGQLEVARLLRGRTWLTAVNAAEVCDQMVRVFGSDPDAVQADLALLGHTGMAVVPVSPEMAIEAGRIRARRYHREHAAVGLAGCMAAAAALAVQQPLATADSALAKVVRAEGGDIHPLPDSKGRLPCPRLVGGHREI